MLNLNIAHCNRETLVKTRVWFNGLCTVYLVMLAVYLMPLDFHDADDPKILMYKDLKWMLITSWANLLMLFYFSTGLYCDWRELQGEGHTRHVQILNTLRDSCFTNVLFPVIVFADTLFWRLWNKDKDLIAPPGIEKYISIWVHHSLHTLSLVVVIVDLCLVPRQRPKSFKPGLLMLSGFLTAYNGMALSSMLNGVFLYPVLETMSTFKLCLLGISIYTENFLYFVTEWLLIDLIWRNRDIGEHKKNMS